MLKAFVTVIALLVFVGESAALTVNDSRGPQEFESVPKRAIALSWSMAEQLVELGVAPIAIADVEGYNTWVVNPALPPETQSVGLRNEPNIERISELQPDLIVISDEHIEIASVLEQIAPVLHFEAFSADHDNAAHARQVYLDLATLFGREDYASSRLKDLDARLATMKARLQDHFKGDVPAVAPVRLLDTSHVRIYGANSMAQAALTALGITHALPQPTTEWGFVSKRIEDLGQVTDGAVLNIEPFHAAEQLYSTALWKAMPFVRADRFASTRPAWTFGGPFSVGYLAEAFTEALLALDQ